MEVVVFKQFMCISVPQIYVSPFVRFDKFY